MTITAVFLLLFGPVQGWASSCDSNLRSRQYRHLPVDGLPKDGIVDYKLINQLLMSLRRAVADDHPRPDGFTAELAAARASDAPVGGIILRGHSLVIEIQRDGLAVIVTVTHTLTGQTVEMELSSDDYGRIFPFRPPSGRGMLLSVIAGLQSKNLL